MRAYREKCLQTDGTRRLSARWYVEWRDHNGQQRRWAGGTEKKVAEAMGRQLERLAAHKRAEILPPPDLLRWFDVQTLQRQSKIKEVGLLGAQEVRSGALKRHLTAHIAHLVANEKHPRHVENRRRQVETMLVRLGANSVQDIKRSKVEQVLADLRDKGISYATSNHYLTSIKAFLNWLVDEEIIEANPLSRMKMLNADADRRHARRALTHAELKALLKAARGGGDHMGLAADQRYWAYRLASELGLLVDEMRHLIPANFDLGAKTVRLGAKWARKRGTEHVLPIRKATAKSLRGFLIRFGPRKNPFPLPQASAKMLRFDLEAAGVPYRDDEGLVADFYSLRHTAGTNMARTAPSYAALQLMLRHKPGSTMTAKYTHVAMAELRRMVETGPVIE